MSPDQIVELIDAITIIKWGVVCIAVSSWGVTVYLLLQEILKKKN